MSKQKKYYFDGFIVHPFETTDNMYHASYGKNANKTVKSFKTLKEAKLYLAKNNVEEALYDSPSGDKTIYPVKYKKISSKSKRKKRKSNPLYDVLYGYNY